MTRRRLALFARLLGGAVVFVGIPALLFEHGSRTHFRAAPAAPVFALWAGWFFVRAWRLRRVGKGALAFNVGFLFLALAGAELFVGHVLMPKARYLDLPDSRPLARKDPLLGHRPHANLETRFVKVAGDDEIFDVIYTTGSDGLRARPPLADPPPKGSVLCFACSFAWGTGLQDDETWPWRLEMEFDGTLRVYNFGCPGHSPGQMLAWLESGEAAAKVRHPPRHIVYLAIEDHARRVIGQGGARRDEPRYVLQPDGTLKRDGQWKDAPSGNWGTRLHELLSHSRVARLLLDWLAPQRGDVERLAAIVETAKDEVEAAWPGCGFHVLLWDSPPSRTDRVEAALRGRGLEVIRASSFLEGLRDDPSPWRLHRLDEHPNAEAAAAIARYLARQLPH